MKPFFRAGQMVAVQPSVPDVVEKGSIVVFRMDDSACPVIHRVIDIAHDGDRRLFLCRGDNRSRPDGYIREDRIMGKVIGRYRNGKFKPLARRHEYGGLILAGIYRRLKPVARRMIVAAWPLISKWFIQTVTVRDHRGRDRELVFVGWGNLRLARNFNNLAASASARKRD